MSEKINNKNSSEKDFAKKIIEMNDERRKGKITHHEYNKKLKENTNEVEEKEKRRIEKEVEKTKELKEKNKKIDEELNKKKEEEEKKESEKTLIQNIFSLKTGKEIVLKLTGLKAFTSFRDFKKIKGEKKDFSDDVSGLMEDFLKRKGEEKLELKNKIREIKQKHPEKYDQIIEILRKNRRKKEDLKDRVQTGIDGIYKQSLREKKEEAIKESINTALGWTGTLTGGWVAYTTVILRTLNNLRFDLSKNFVNKDGEIDLTDFKTAISNFKESWTKKNAVGKVSEAVRYASLGYMLYKGYNMNQMGTIDNYNTLLGKMKNGIEDIVNNNGNVTSNIVDSVVGNKNINLDNVKDTVSAENVPQNHTGFTGKIKEIFSPKTDDIKENIPFKENVDVNTDVDTLKENVSVKDTQKASLDSLNIKEEFNKLTEKYFPSGTYQIEKGDTTWSIVKEKLLKGSLKLNEGKNALTDDQMNNLTANILLKLKNEIAEGSGDLKKEWGCNLSAIQVGDKINMKKFLDIIENTKVKVDGNNLNILERAHIYTPPEKLSGDIFNYNDCDGKPCGDTFSDVVNYKDNGLGMGTGPVPGSEYILNQGGSTVHFQTWNEFQNYLHQNQIDSSTINIDNTNEEISVNKPLICSVENQIDISGRLWDGDRNNINLSTLFKTREEADEARRVAFFGSRKAEVARSIDCDGYYRLELVNDHHSSSSSSSSNPAKTLKQGTTSASNPAKTLKQGTTSASNPAKTLKQGTTSG